MVRRNRSVRSELQLALHKSEIERLKAIVAKITDGRQLVITPSDPGPGGPTTPGVEPAAHVLYGSKHSRALRVTDNGSIDIAFEQGQIWVGGTFFSIGAGTLTLTDNTTNYVFVDNAGAVDDNTTGFPADSAPLALVTTVAGDITALADRRAYLSAGAFGAGAILGNPLTVGVDDTTHGEAWLYGDGAASTAGGALRMYLAADHDGTFHWWELDVFEDDLRFFSSDNVVVNIMTAAGQLQLPVTGSGAGLLLGGDAQIYRSGAGILDMPGGKLRVGVVDNTAGVLVLYGVVAAGGAEGGEIQLELADDHNAVFNSWNIDVSSDDLRFFRSSGELGMVLKAERQLQIPTTGVGAGILLGGDALLYRSGANVFTTPDSLVVENTITVGDGNSADNEVLVKFAIDRAWQFEVDGNDAGTRLVLRALADQKQFVIQSADSTDVLAIAAANTGTSSTMTATMGYFDFSTRTAEPTAPSANFLRYFVFDGVGRIGVPVWKDENSDLYIPPREAAVLVPHPVDGSGALVAGTVVLKTSAFVGIVTVTAPITLDKITYNVALAGADADNVIRIALYSEDGQTRLVDETDNVGTATGLRVVTLGADVLLPPGNYYAFMCYQSGTGGGPTPTLMGTQALFHTGGSGEPDLGGRLTITAGAAPTTFDPTAITTPGANEIPYFRFDGA